MRTQLPFAEVQDERIRVVIILTQEHTRQTGCFRVYFDHCVAEKHLIFQGVNAHG